MAKGQDQSVRKYWDVTENDVYIRVFGEIFQEIDLSFVSEDAVDEFLSLSLHARYIVTRLFLRTIKWLSAQELEKYLPPDQLSVALDELVAKEWLLDTPKLDDQLDAANLKVLQSLADAFGVKKTGLLRPELVASLTKTATTKGYFSTTTLADKMSAKLRALGFNLYMLNTSKSAMLENAAFLFLCPAFTTIDTIVRTNMKMISFLDYEYTPQKDLPIFGSKTDFDEYKLARAICDPLEETTRPLEERWVVILRSSFETAANVPGSFSAKYVYGRGVGLLTRFLGKAKRFQEEYDWINYYLDQSTHVSFRAELYIRRLLLELKFYTTQSEISWLTKGINTYYDSLEFLTDISKYDMDRKVVKLSSLLKAEGLTPPSVQLSRRGKVPVYEYITEQRPSLSGGKTQWGVDVAASVEDAALAHYSESGWDGGHFENGTLKTIFALLCYDIIFEDKTLLRCRYQTRPMRIQKILETQRTRIDARLNDPDFLVRLEQNYNLLSPKKPQILGIHWDYDIESLTVVARALKNQLGLLLGRLLANYSRYGSGFPDLTLWREVDGQAECKFVEVKSTNDVMSDSQYAWIEFMIDIGVDVEICRVLSKGNKRKVADLDADPELNAEL